MDKNPNIKTYFLQNIVESRFFMLLRKPEVGKTDLLTVHPEIKDEWDYEKNYPLTPQDVFPKAGIKVHWKCEKGHSYERTIITKVTKSHNCPYCTGDKIIEGKTDIFSIYPQLKEEWDYEKNDLDHKMLAVKNTDR